MLPNYTGNLNGIRTSWDEAVEFVTRRAQRLLKESRITAPPFLPEYLAPLQGVKRIIRKDLGNLSGLLLPLRDGFEIKINATHSPERQNYSCAHEIAHTFFFEEEGRTLIEKLTRENGRKTIKNMEEDLCNIAASELLMPSQIFIKHASRYQFRIHSVTLLSRTFNTSIVPTVLRLCDLNPHTCMLVYWAGDKSYDLDDLSVCAKWLTWSRKRISAKAGRFFFKPKIFGEHSSILEAYMSDNPTYSYQWMGVGNFRGNCKMWSQGFGSGPRRFVISLIFAECDN